MKIAFIIPSLSPQASIRYPLSLADGLRTIGCDCHVFYFNNSSDRISEVDATQITFSTKVNWTEFDVVNTHGFLPDLYWFIKKPIFGDIPLSVSTLHGFFRPHFQEKYGTILSLLLSAVWMVALSRTHHCVVFTKFAKTQYPLISNRKFYVIPSGIKPFAPKAIPSTDFTIFEQLRSEKRFILGFVGRLVEVKGIPRVFPYLLTTESTHLVIVGDGPFKEKLIRQIRALNLQDHVTFLGYRESAKDYIHHFDALIMPSVSETFGLTLLEAACVKTPAICSDIPTFKELFSDSEVSYFISSVPESIIDSIETLRVNPQSKVNNFNKKYLTEYTLEKMALRYLNLFKSKSQKKYASF